MGGSSLTWPYYAKKTVTLLHLDRVMCVKVIAFFKSIFYDAFYVCKI